MLPSEPPPLSRTLPRRPRILLVDDDPSVIRALRRMLGRFRPNLQINTAGSAAQALTALKHLDYDIVITDFQMPGGSGAVVLEALAKYRPETHRFVHSSQLESGDAECIRALAHVVLAKPTSKAELLAAVEGALPAADGRRLGSG